MPHILNLTSRWRRVICFTLQGKIPQYTLDRKLGKPQSQSGHSGEEKKFLPVPGIAL